MINGTLVDQNMPSISSHWSPFVTKVRYTLFYPLTMLWAEVSITPITSMSCAGMARRKRRFHNAQLLSHGSRVFGKLFGIGGRAFLLQRVRRPNQVASLPGVSGN
jgi:hypothetical protein